MQRIIFFDGVCNLCDSIVNLVFKIDKRHIFMFASLQSETAKKLLNPEDLKLETIVYYDTGYTYYFSDAVIKILTNCGGVWAFTARLLSLLPKSFLDWIYKQVAVRRYKIFGKKDSCRLPNESEKFYFLD